MTFLEELMQDFQKMLDFRTSVGYATATYVSSVTPFIHFCGENYPEANCITHQMLDDWIAHYSYKKKGTQAAFICLIRQYTKFINSLGKEAFVPDSDYTVRRERYLPYVFTDEELTGFFDSVDKIPTRNKNFQREIILPVLFRMMYCCGMRPSEPLRLRCEDVDLKTGSVYIRQTKKNKDRHIIMSNDLLALCQKYDEIVGVREWFFQRKDKAPYATNWMTNQFHICWNRSGLIKRGSPRPYDLSYPNLNKILTF